MAEPRRGGAGNQRQTPADLIILDIGLPDISGFETCKQLRRFSEVPVLFLSARDAEIDRVVGLEIGADDYVVKPFSPREVAARVNAILKRMAPRPAIEATSAVFRIDPERVQISYRGQTLSLTRHEFRLLQCLLEQPERVFSREQLLDALGVAAMPVTSATSTAISKACAPNCAWCAPKPNRSRPIAASVTATARAQLMSLGLRIFLVYVLFIGLTGYFVLNTVMEEIRPGVRQSTEETLVDTANLMAEILRDDFKAGTLSENRWPRLLPLMVIASRKRISGACRKIRSITVST